MERFIEEVAIGEALGWFEKMQQGLKTGDQAWDAMCEVARYGNPASRSDVEVGARSLATGIWGAYKNVQINLPDIKDEAFKAATLETADKIMARADEKCAEVLAILEG